MTKLLKENIILPAWNTIKSDTKIKKFYLFPWLLSIIFLTVLLVYQSIYTYVEIFWKKEEALVIILKFFHSDYVFEILIWSVIFIIIYFLCIPIFEWWLIKYLNKKDNWEELSSSEVLWEWLYRFLPVFEYNNIFSEFKIISILNWYLFTIRFIWIEYLKVISYIFIVLLFLGIFVNIILSYSKYIIIIEKKWVFESVWKSAKITILNLKRTVKLYFLMLILNIRVIFNFVIFLIFPVAFVVVLWVITTKIFLILAITILSLLFIAFIIALWYLTAVLEVFKTTIWYFAYKEWIKKLDDE